MKTDAMDLWGRALMDQFRGEGLASGLLTIDARGDRNREDLDEYFENVEDSYATYAYERCRGRVLDVGAGVGRHTLALQSRGLDVTALETSPLAVELLSLRGVARPVQGDIFEFEDSRGFDTILILDSIGLAGSLQGLHLLFQRSRQLLRPGGRILLDAEDFAPGEPTHTIDGVYRGEEYWQFQYGEAVSDAFPWLATLGRDTCRQVASDCGLELSVVVEFEELYLAELMSADE